MLGPHSIPVSLVGVGRGGWICFVGAALLTAVFVSGSGSGAGTYVTPGPQSNLTQPFPGGVQIPQEGLQQDSFGGQRLEPHTFPWGMGVGMPGEEMGTQVGVLLGSMLQVWLGRQSIRAQEGGWGIVFVGEAVVRRGRRRMTDKGVIEVVLNIVVDG